jgi:sulfur-oxidizing protein SoxX
MTLRTLVLAATALAAPSLAQAQDKVDPARLDALVKATFGGAPADWKARIELDETQRICSTMRNNVTAAQADEIQKRELARMVLPADSKFLGDWKKGFQVANNGRGGQFSDGPDTVNGGNCYACHQMDPKEVSFGTLGPSLAGYGKDRKYDKDMILEAWRKIYNSQAVVACSNMPRFGASKFLTEQQIKDVMAYLFDPDSPVNK